MSLLNVYSGMLLKKIFQINIVGLKIGRPVGEFWYKPWPNHELNQGLPRDNSSSVVRVGLKPAIAGFKVRRPELRSQCFSRKDGVGKMKIPGEKPRERGRGVLTTHPRSSVSLSCCLWLKVSISPYTLIKTKSGRKSSNQFLVDENLNFTITWSIFQTSLHFVEVKKLAIPCK